MDDASEDAGGLITPARQRRTGQGVWAGAVVVIALAVAGLAVSAAVLWLQLVEQTNEADATRLTDARADDLAALLDARILDLQRTLESAAAAPESLRALTSDDPAARDRAETALAAVMPYAVRVELFAPGEARLDRDAPVPISFAALKLIERAETEPFSGPEGMPLDNRAPLFYAARPVLDRGTVTGVLFVALSAEFLLDALEPFDPAIGQLTLRQEFSGTAPVALLQWGEPGTASPVSVQKTRTLSVPHWHVVFDPNEAALPPVARIGDLLVSLAPALGLLLAGVLFAFSSLSRRLRQDADGLMEQVSSALRGRRQPPHRYKLALFQDLAREIGRLARPVSVPEPAPARPAAAGRSRASSSGEGDRPEERSKETEVNDLLDDEHERPGPRKRAASDDFLDVRSSGPDDNFGIEVTEDTSPLAMGLTLEPEIFRAYDIRGITTKNLTEDVVYWIGRAFAAEARDCGQQRVAVGRDGRHSSAPLRDALTRGLTEGGVDVLDIGRVPTPVLYFATHVLGTGTGVMITGSHNPPDYNGLKMMIGGETLAEKRIQGLRARLEENRLSEGEGEIEEVDVAAQYLERIVGDVVVAQPLKVVVDCGNGVAGVLAPELIRQLGCDVVPLYCDVDGDFPNHHPDPAEPKNLEDLITVVKAEQADIGLAFDGDGDRLGVVTGRGEIIWPDKLLMLYAQDIVGRNPGADIIYDVKCSRHLNNLISDLGGRPIMWKTGHSHVKAKLKETGALLAGEFSGHICFGERWYGFDDALYSAARLLEILGASDADADELFAQFPVTYSTPELKIQTTEQAKFEIIQRLAIDGDFGDGTVTTIDGLRVDYPDGWGLIRPSNTSPVLSLRFEADGQEALDRIQDLFQAQLRAIDPSLRFR
ncbi:MAG TPA: phosphomannomutase/phosphoglucomutase [Pseudomonadales bacterium]